MPINYTACLLDFLPIRAADVVGKVSQRVIYGDLSRYGLPKPTVGAQTRTMKLHQSVLVDAGFVSALKEGRIEVVAAVKAFEGADVILADGTRLRPDAVIAATGYSRGLEPIVGHLGVLDADGFPLVLGPRTHPNAPHLYFNGYLGTVSGGLRHMRRHARAIARAIVRNR